MSHITTVRVSSINEKLSKDLIEQVLRRIAEKHGFAFNGFKQSVTVVGWGSRTKHVSNAFELQHGKYVYAVTLNGQIIGDFFGSPISRNKLVREISQEIERLSDFRTVSIAKNPDTTLLEKALMHFAQRFENVYQAQYNGLKNEVTVNNKYGATKTVRNAYELIINGRTLAVTTSGEVIGSLDGTNLDMNTIATQILDSYLSFCVVQFAMENNRRVMGIQEKENGEIELLLEA